MLLGGGLPIAAEDGDGGGAVAPGGHLDEACAQAGINKIADRLK